MVDRLDELRQLLLGEEQQKLETLEHRLEEAKFTPEELAELLPEAFLKKSSDQHLILSLIHI